jgi:hypothetical protein
MIQYLTTKQKGDVAEYAVLLEALKLGYNVLKPIGDRLPYDFVFEINGKFIKIQVKSAYKDGNSWIVDTRRTKTNRRVMKRTRYTNTEVDFVIAYIEDINKFHLITIADFNKYKSGYTINITKKPLDNWNIL